MKNLSILVACFLCLAISCDKETVDPDVVDSWQLVEMLSDPGDGSGVFMPVNSDKTITFYTNGQVECLGYLCQHSAQSGTVTTGTYSLVDSTINGTNCNILNFELSQNYLIIDYPCIEPCRAKYEKQ